MSYSHKYLSVLLHCILDYIFDSISFLYLSFSLKLKLKVCEISENINTLIYRENKIVGFCEEKMVAIKIVWKKMWH